MKRLWIAILCAFLLSLGCAMAESYSLDEALALVGSAGLSGNGMLELNEDFSDIDFMTAGDFQSAGGKTIILWREDADQKFEVSETPFPEKYEGTALEAPRVWLCAELMEQIPGEQRAKSREEVSNILIAETRYVLSGQITTTMGNSLGGDALTEEDIKRYVETGILPRGAFYNSYDTEHEYRPVFACFECVSLYNVETQTAEVFSVEMYDHAELRSNPGADDIWQDMRELMHFVQLTEIYEGQELGTQLEQVFREGGFEYSLTEEDYAELEAKVNGGDAAGAADICTRLFWENAGLLKEADPELSEAIDKAQMDQDMNALARLADARDYSSLEKSTSEIKKQKLYQGRPDFVHLKEMLQDTLELFDAAEWDMRILSMAINDYYQAP